MIHILLFVVDGTLPPPPTPSPNEPLAVWQVFAIAALVLGAVTLIAFSWRNHRPRRVFTMEETMREGDDLRSEPSAPVEDDRAILHFPQRDEVPAPRPPTVVPNRATWSQGAPVSNPIVSERLRKVTSTPGGERRRLGDRQARIDTSIVPRERQSAAPSTIRPLAMVRPQRPAQSLVESEAQGAEIRPTTLPDVSHAAAEPVVEAPATPAMGAFDHEMRMTPGAGLELGTAGSSRSPRSDVSSGNRPIGAAAAGDGSPLIGERAPQCEEPIATTAEVASAQRDAPMVGQLERAARPDDSEIAAVFADIVAALAAFGNAGGTAATAIDQPRAAEDRTAQLIGNEEIVDLEIREGVENTLRELLYCANLGELLHGFALYTDPFLFRTMDETGLDEEEFHRVFAAMPARSIGTWTRFGGFQQLRLEPDGSVTAAVRYRPPAIGEATPPERYRFVLNRGKGVWMIDDISPVDAVAFAVA